MKTVECFRKCVRLLDAMQVLMTARLYVQAAPNEPDSLFATDCIIEDLPKPVKNACDALPSAVVSDNLIEIAEVKMSR